MRRIGRWMLNALTALSLLLCVATCVLWVRSCGTYETFDKTRYDVAHLRSNRLSACWQSDRLSIFYEHEDYSPGEIEEFNQSVEHNSDWHHQRLGLTKDFPGIGDDRPAWMFGYDPPHHAQMDGGFSEGSSWNVSAAARVSPFVFTTMILPAMWLWRVARNRRRERRGLCPACSYDLTANVSGVCPECGAKVAEAK